MSSQTGGGGGGRGMSSLGGGGGGGDVEYSYAAKKDIGRDNFSSLSPALLLMLLVRLNAFDRLFIIGEFRT